MSDRLQRFVLRNAPVRGELVSLDLSWSEVVIRHALPSSVRNQLGELAAAGLLLAATLKFEGKLILQIHGKGPVSLYVVECDAGGRFRATVKLRADTPIPEDATLDQLVNVGGSGRFVVTLDPGAGAGQAYQGIVPFDGGTIAKALEHYMARSEQLPTRLWLAADEHRATGLLLQRLPDHGGKAGDPGAAIDEDGWNRMNHLADTISAEELLTLPSDEVLKRLFWQETLDGREDRPCRFECSCNRTKVGAMLKMLGRAEIDDVLAEQSHVTVNCDFCNQTYEFDAVDCAELFATEHPDLRPPGGDAIN
ncbi:MAG: Hsp33 family molecular chaperone HslO [Burkholderiaceae bacterium]